MTESAEETDRVTSLHAVLETGLRIMDEEGLKALSIRRLATELGIGSMTPYVYVRTKQELLDKIADLVLNENFPAPPAGGTWQEELDFVVRHLYEALRGHPGVIEIVAGRGVPIPALDRFRERMLDILDRAGFSSQRAVEIVSICSIYATGFAQMGLARAGLDREAEAARLRGLLRNEFPHLTRVAEDYASHISEHAFETGLTSLIRGLDAGRQSARADPAGT
jgi:AcrR family transcriptional regulator